MLRPTIAAVVQLGAAAGALAQSLLLACALLLPAASQAALSRDQAAALVARGLGGGRVLAVEGTESGGRPAWRVKVVTATGDVRVMVLDAGLDAPGSQRLPPAAGERWPDRGR